MSKFDKMIKSLSWDQIAFARTIQANGIDSYSQAVKALANEDDETIARWKAQLDELEAKGELKKAPRY